MIFSLFERREYSFLDIACIFKALIDLLPISGQILVRNACFVFLHGNINFHLFCMQLLILNLAENNERSSIPIHLLTQIYAMYFF